MNELDVLKYNDNPVNISYDWTKAPDYETQDNHTLFPATTPSIHRAFLLTVGDEYLYMFFGVGGAQRGASAYLSLCSRFFSFSFSFLYVILTRRM